MASYKVVRGISYGAKRAEVGEIVTDIPESSVAWLLAVGVIEETDQPKPTKTKPKASEPVSDSKGDE